MIRLRPLVLLLVLLTPPGRTEPPAVMLAEVLQRDEPIELADYWVSEKLDGVRAYWDGRQLVSRNGNAFALPRGYTRNWPATPMDGELWSARGEFERISGTVRQAIPDAAAWSAIRYHVFDLPAHGGRFDERLRELKKLVEAAGSPTLRAVEQYRLASIEALHRHLDQVVAAGGEGLMLHRGSSYYRGERSSDLLKLKPFDDAEAVVVAHLPGKGRHEGRLGALLVERPDGLRFRIGTGFTDAERETPPPIGSTVTYAYSGLTQAGVPRFARYLRVRNDQPPARDVK